jgi:uncharacterized secreted protein with C-terminal beta-propeller domain
MLLQRLALAFAALLVSLASLAATVEDRSPFRQGHWWDPTRSGHGFEMLSAGENVFVVWYTYDASESPVWYTAQGTVKTLGSDWPLLKHWWSGGRLAQSAPVGSLRLGVNHFESVSASWTLGASQGTWKIEPFVMSGTINEVDLSGHWFDPTNSGWGMTLVDQGDVFGAVLYAYDPHGSPTWLAGFDRGQGTRINMLATRGPCPSCGLKPVVTQSAGTVEVGYEGDSRITVNNGLTVPLATGLRIHGAQGRQLGRPASTRRADYQLVPFGSEERLKAFLVEGMANRTFYAASDFSSPGVAAPAPSFSTTNVQVEGVDEADLVKTNGRYLYSLSPITGSYGMSFARKVRIAELAPNGAGLAPAGEIPLLVPDGLYGNYAEAGLYLHERNLVTLSSGSYYGGWYYSAAVNAETNIEMFSLANPVAPISHYRAKLPGTMVSSRRIGDRLYVVTRFTPNVSGYNSYAYTDAMRLANRQLLDAAPLSSLLPWISENNGAARPVVAPSSVHAPQYGANPPVADLVVVSVFDVRSARFVEALAVAGRTDSMFVSNSAIYLASARYDMRPMASTQLLPVQPSLLNTDIHQVRVDGSQLRIAATGSIEGAVGWGEKAAFRFGELNGRLAVVSSNNTTWWGDANRNRLTILEPSTVAPGLLKTVSYLPNAARPETLGKPGEALYATRFVGDKLYAVTFRQTDPLYTVDLSKPSDPRITGELQIPGFSDYLHPLPNGLLLGFGRNATATGVLEGLQLSLFDVNGAAPRELQRISIGQRGSDSPVFSSHRAMSILPRADGTTVFAFPAAIHDGPVSFWGGYQWQYSGLLRFEVRGTTADDARLVHAQTLKTAIAATPAASPTSRAEYSYGYGRSVLFPSSTVYAGDALWHQDASGNVVGPY